MAKKRKNTPSLRFGPGGISGWTPVGVSGFRGLKPTTAVRELIQNGLDASEAIGNVPARLRFQVAECPTNEVPAIEAYREAFEDARETQRKLSGGSLPDNAKAITDDIEQCLKKETCEILYVLDNGIGLDKERMGAVLGDGLSFKEQGATGSFGNGHVVIFPASDLRYVLYGGLSDNNMICSGHTILASRQNRKGGDSLDNDGYFVKKLNTGDSFDRYVFPQNEEIPSLVQDRLVWIKENWETGSVVAVMGFNHFRESDTDIKEQVFRAAACNFFEAIYDNHLIIEVEKDGKTVRLDKDNLHGVLESYRDQKRSKDSFLSGNRAYEAMLTLEQGRRVAVETDMGDMEIFLRCPIESGMTRVDLCRNGMWITDHLPKFQNQFGALKAFHCVLPLRKNAVVNRLVRKAEGPLHKDLKLLQMSDPKDRKRLSNVLDAVRKKLYEEVPELSNDTFRPDDIFTVQMGGIVQGGKRSSMKGTPTKVGHRRPRLSEDTGGEGGSYRGRETGKGSGGNGRSGTFKRAGNRMQFQALAVPINNRSCRVSIVPGAKASESEIRFALDESIDDSDSFSRESFVYLNADTLRLNGHPVPPESLQKDKDGNVLGIMLGSTDTKEGQNNIIDMDYTIPEHFSVKDDQQVVLTIEMIRRASQGKAVEG